MEPLTEVTFGEWLKRQRRGMGLTQQQLAAQINYSTIALKKIEAEERRPSPEVVERLAEIFKIPPEERTAFLRFARGDWGSAPASKPGHVPPESSRAAPKSNLPASVTSLIGREKSVAEVYAQLLRPEIRLLTLIGPPGIGKTRLSLESARTALSDFPDGVFFIALAPLEEPALIALTVVQALNFVETNRQSDAQRLAEGIRDKHMLLVLDNCEHLIEDVARLASFLLSTCSRLKILTTSRESLRIPGEWLYTVPAFDLPVEQTSVDFEHASQYPALRLFEERARSVRSDFSLTSDNIETVAAICARLDGLPLVIELMAARMRLMSPDVLLERLTGQFVLTADGMRAPSERQKTLRNAIDWSYNLLSASEQKLFACLSVFSGGFTMDAAEAMFSHIFPGQASANLVASLLDKSLLQRAPGRDARFEQRYTMLGTIQEFAREKLLEMGKTTETLNLHLAYFCKLAEQAQPQLRSAGQLAWLERLDVEYDNIRVAMNWAQASGAVAEGLGLVTHLELFWVWRVHTQEPCLVLEQLLAQPVPATAIQAAVRGHRLIGYLNWNSSNKISTEAHLKESERLSKLLGPEGAVDAAWARHVYQSFMHSAIPQTPLEIQQRYDRFLKVLQAAGDPWETASLLADMGRELERSGDFPGSHQALAQSLSLFRECGDMISASKTNAILVYLAMVHGNYADARPQLEEILHFYRQARLNFFMDIPLWLLGVIAVREGDYTRAKDCYSECLLFDQQIGLPRQLAECFIGFAGIANAEQHFERAARLLSIGETNAAARANPLESIEQIELQRLTTRLREELGNASFEALALQGRTMTMEQAIAYALEDRE